MNLVYILWIILLVVTVMLLPMIILRLHKTYKAAKSIERYFAEMRDAGMGIANHTGAISALDDTIKVATGMLEVAGNINQHADTLKTALSERAETMP